MSCPFLKDGRCELAERIAQNTLGLTLNCDTTPETCGKCQSKGPPSEQTPTLACLGNVTPLVPLKLMARWTGVTSALAFGRSQSRPAPVQEDPPPAVAAPPKQKRKWRGAGDVVAAVTSAVGIKPCGGCKKRQEWLNQKMPFGKQD